MKKLSNFPERQNDVDQIAAEHINLLQQAIHNLELAAFKLQDNAFVAYAKEMLMHNPEVNTLWYDVFEGETRLDMGLIVNADLDNDSRTISIQENHEQCELVWRYKHSEGASITDFILLSRSNPADANIVYEISQDGINFYTISPNEAPLRISADSDQFILRATMQRATEDPVLHGVALLYKDPTLN